MAQATGSPASRNPTKLTPLTTRPSLTSRQGMSRALSKAFLRCTDERERRPGIEPAIVKRAAGDRAGEFRAVRHQQSLHVPERGKPARSDNGNCNSTGERQSRRNVQPRQRAVARYIGIDDGGNARILELPAEIDRARFDILRPAFNRNLAIARIDPD